MKKNLVVGIIAAVLLLSLVIALASRPEGGEIIGKKQGEAIGVIYIEGIITGGRAQGGVFGGEAGAGDLLEQIRQAREDDAVKAVLLRINSPGGSAAASQEIGDEIERLKKAGKKVVVSMGDVAASGGYWIAAKADRIVANPATMTGSIGVIMQTPNLQELYDKIGYREETFKSGPHKDMGSPSRSVTPEERQILQGMINDIYEQFVDVVAKGRKMDRNKVREVADGRIFTGRQAKGLGLVDELGNYYDAVRITGKLAGIEGEPVIIEYGPVSPFEKLLGGIRGALGAGLLERELAALRRGTFSQVLESPALPQTR
jgi:protease-4